MDAKHLGQQPVGAVPYDDADQHQGITLRQHYAGLAMQGYIAADHTGMTMTPPEVIARLAVAAADALLAELAKGRP